MGKRKVFNKTDIGVPEVDYYHDLDGNLIYFLECVPPAITVVKFGRNALSGRSFDFARCYGAGIDPITYACQRQTERFLAGQDNELTASTVASQAKGGLRYFLDYCLLRSMALARDLHLSDVNRDLIDGYLGHLNSSGLEVVSQKGVYSQTKTVLTALGQRGLISLIFSGDAATFPYNPFPNIARKVRGETALSTLERRAFSVALQQAIKPIWSEDVTLTSELLVFALLVVALHTGRNTTPILEMHRDCLRPHPKEDTVFLVLWKRRGHNTSKVALRAESSASRVIESIPGVKTNVASLIRRVIALTEDLKAEAPPGLEGRVWLYRSRNNRSWGDVTALTGQQLVDATARLVADYDLKNGDGKPLSINISRLRKTFANRIFELADGDLSATAAALGNTVRVTEKNYLAPGENARRDWQFMGEVLVQELLNRTIGTTYKDTPLGKCADPVTGHYAPKREGVVCMNFMNCLRCKHYAVTADDLYKLFSFYYRVLAERARMDRKRWKREYSHIPRLIDHYIVAEGLRRGTFKASSVEAAREQARTRPHPFWSVDLISDLEVFA
jgi:hypothetical protein